MTFRAKDETRYRTSLPFHSVGTKEEAEMIQVTHCKRSYDEPPKWLLNNWRQDLPEEERVGQVMLLADKLGLT